MDLTLESVGVCNLKCKMCPTSYYSCNKGIMSDETFNNIIPYLNLFKKIELTGWGEPLLDNKIFEKAKIYKENNCTFSFTTNATLLDEEKTRKIIELSPASIQFSIDSGDSINYQNIRINSDFQEVIKNIKYFLEYNKNTKKISTSVALVIMKSNISFIDKFIDLVNSLEVDFVSFKPIDIIVSEEQIKETLEKNELIKIIDQIKLKLKKNISLVTWNIYKREKGDCLAKAGKNIFISWDGNVYPCCVFALNNNITILKKKIAFYRRFQQDNFCLGNVNKEALNEILEHKHYLDFINTFKNKKIPAKCRGCLLI